MISWDNEKVRNGFTEGHTATARQTSSETCAYNSDNRQQRVAVMTGVAAVLVPSPQCNQNRHHNNMEIHVHTFNDCH